MTKYEFMVLFSENYVITFPQRGKDEYFVCKGSSNPQSCAGCTVRNECDETFGYSHTTVSKSEMELFIREYPERAI